VEGRPLDDQELVERAKGGDTGAYGELVKRYQGIAYRTAFMVTREPGDADDAAQTGFTKAYYALGRFRAGAPFRPWLLKIVMNEARNRVRARGRRATAELKVAEGRPTGDAAPSPEAAALATEDAQRLLGAVNELGEKDRLVVTCRYFLEMSEAETAAVLGWRLGTVKSRLSRALERLREVLVAEEAVDG
jgi:RNA polymerase sigma factor (sigma-70 family)